MPGPDGKLERAFRAARRRDSLRALQGCEVAVEIKGRALYNLAKHNWTYPGNEKALVDTLLLVAGDLLVEPLAKQWVSTTGRSVRYVAGFASCVSILAALSMLLGTVTEPLAVQCESCDEWFRPGDYYDLTEHVTDLYLCHGCVVGMTAEELIEGYLL